MHAKLQRVEVEALRCRDDDLAVEDAAGRQQPLEGVVQLGEVAIERAQIAALDEHARRAAKHDGAKAVPLRFVQEFTAGRQRLDGLREHRGNRRLYCETVESGHQGVVSPATARTADADSTNVAKNPSTSLRVRLAESGVGLRAAC